MDRTIKTPGRPAFPRLAAAAIALFAGALLSAEEAGAGDPRLAALDAYLRAFVASNRIPGLSVAVVKDGEAAFLGAYGKAGPGRPMATDTRMRLASLSKSFTALAVLRLEAEGRVELDAPLRRVLPGFALKSGNADAITPRMLLNQTSGLGEPGDPDPNPRGSSLEDELASMAGVEPFAPAGARYRYYNKNYRLLGLAIEKASGLPYPEYLRREIFVPLGMSGATAEAGDGAGIARGYAPFFALPIGVRTPGSPGEAPSGGLAASAEDMAKYLSAYQRAARGEEGVIDPGILARMKEGPEGPASPYGMGWMIEEGGRRLCHGGDCEGFHAFAEVDEASGFGYAILINQNGLLPMLGAYDGLPLALRAILAGRKAPSPGSSAALPWIMAALAALALLDQLRLFLRLPAWLARASKRFRPIHALKLAFGLALPAATFLLLPSLICSLLGVRGGWGDIFPFMPDIVVLVIAAQSLTLLRALLRAFLLLRAGRAARRAMAARS